MTSPTTIEEEEKGGRVGKPTGLSQAEPQEGLGPSGFDPSRVWHCVSEKPRDNSRVVVLYADGSGALLGFWTGETLFDQDGDESEWENEWVALWAYLPHGFGLWCETRRDDAYTFPSDSDGSPEGRDRNGLDGEAATARAGETGIAQSDSESHP